MLAAALVMAPAARAAAAPSWSFVSDPDRHPARLSVLVDRPSRAPGLIFVAPIRGPRRGRLYGQRGPLITDAAGVPVWSYPLAPGQSAMGFRPQLYRGRRVLTWWQGRLLASGIGAGEGEIFDSRYRRIATIRVPGTLGMDPHELELTPRGTALFAADRLVRRDLRPYGGRRDGELVDTVVEEASVRTRRVVWRWDALRHVSLSESYTRPAGSRPWDAFHFNSVDVDAHGNRLISLRNTWTVYDVARTSGRVVWRLGGRRSSFALGSGVRFAGQHDARFGPRGTVTLFDNAIPPSRVGHSRGLVISIDAARGVARLVREFDPVRRLLAVGQGSFEPLAGGGAFVGWGSMPYVSEFGRRGQLLFDARFPGSDETYRAFLSPWAGVPLTSPRVAVRGGAIYASWNGSTRVAAWRVVCGDSRGGLRPVARARRAGFETRVALPRCGRYVAVRAVDRHGRLLATSGTATAR